MRTKRRTYVRNPICYAQMVNFLLPNDGNFTWKSIVLLLTWFKSNEIISRRENMHKATLGFQFVLVSYRDRTSEWFRYTEEGRRKSCINFKRCRRIPRVLYCYWCCFVSYNLLSSSQRLNINSRRLPTCDCVTNRQIGYALGIGVRQVGDACWKTVEKSRDNKFVLLRFFISCVVKRWKKKRREGENKEVELLFRQRRQCSKPEECFLPSIPFRLVNFSRQVLYRKEKKSFFICISIHYLATCCCSSCSLLLLASASMPVNKIKKNRERMNRKNKK